MDRVYIIDDWLEKDLSLYIKEILCTHIPFCINHKLEDSISPIGVHLFEKTNTDRKTYNLDFTVFQNLLIDFIYYKLTKLFDFKVNVSRSYINLYPPGIHDNEYHKDGENKNDVTALYMSSETPDDKSGWFEYIDPKTGLCNSISYVNNRLIIFPCNYLHRGLSFKKHNRTTLTFKCHKIYENSISN